MSYGMLGVLCMLCGKDAVVSECVMVWLKFEGQCQSILFSNTPLVSCTKIQVTYYKFDHVGQLALLKSWPGLSRLFITMS